MTDAQIAWYEARCKRGLHHCEPVVRESIGDFVLAATCCDRLFTLTTDALGRGIRVGELEVDQAKLAELRRGPEWETVSGG